MIKSILFSLWDSLELISAVMWRLILGLGMLLLIHNTSLLLLLFVMIFSVAPVINKVQNYYRGY